MRADVEFLHEGQAEHKQLAAVEVQQHASWKESISNRLICDYKLFWWNDLQLQLFVSQKNKINKDLFFLFILSLLKNKDVNFVIIPELHWTSLKLLPYWWFNQENISNDTLAEFAKDFIFD